MNSKYYIPAPNTVLTADLNFGYLHNSKAYALQEYNNSIYIVDQVSDDEKSRWYRFRGRKKSPREITTKDYNKLLLDTINLIDEKQNWNWGEISVTSLDWSKSFDRIIPFKKAAHWLINYGLPGLDSEAHYQLNTGGYPLYEFKCHIASIYLIYKIHESIMDSNENQLKKQALRLIDQPKFAWASPVTVHDFVLDNSKIALKNRQQAKEKVLNDNFEYTASHARLLTSQIINHHLKDISLQYSIHPNPNFYWLANSLFDICYYQLAVITTLSVEDYDAHKNNLKTCKNCHSTFWGHGNKDYCDSCDRRNVWKKKRKKQKEGSHARPDNQEE